MGVRFEYSNGESPDESVGRERERASGHNPRSAIDAVSCPSGRVGEEEFWLWWGKKRIFISVYGP